MNWKGNSRLMQYAGRMFTKACRMNHHVQLNDNRMMTIQFYLNPHFAVQNNRIFNPYFCIENPG